MKSPYRCLIMDHDDTVVESTPHIHYPAHVASLKQLRPGLPPISLEGWFYKNFNPGLMTYLGKELGFSPEEIQEEYLFWRNYTAGRRASFFPQMLETLITFRERGGIVTVVSHSDVDRIEEDYRAATEGAGLPPFLPDRTFGWSPDEDRRKPHPYPARQILKEFGLKPQEALMVDDLSPGAEMARAAGIPCAAAGWGHNVRAIRAYMRQACNYFFETVEDFSHFILPP